jgi:nitrite reductase/ring-hydroxylating ferredoxin subunit/DMSO/TMAO reductase YedYZ heme-binding membrane subunit
VLRAFGTAAFLLLHVVLSIGPLARLDRRFLPLLYNRRHLGVATFCVALVHGALALVQFHGLGDTHPLVSLLTANPRLDSIAHFPFQPLGLAALGILFLMAATSHDFWLAQLTAPVWKTLHMGVYLAYALLVAHVALGALQSERRPELAVLLVVGVAWLLGVHLVAALRERSVDRERPADASEIWVAVCDAADIPDGRARVVCVAGERVAVFRHGDRISALSNVCQHQNGPLGEGRIVDGCVVCPWHGYEYDPASGRSPAPFTERVPTFGVRVREGRVWLDPRPKPAGTHVEPARMEATVDG